MAEKDYHDKSCPNKRVDLKQALEVIKNNTCMHMGVGGLWPKHAAELAKALETNTAMQMLDLNEYNEVGDEGAEAFGKMFRVNKHLKAIFMANNAITEVGVNHRTVSPATEPQSARLNRDQPDHHEPTRPAAKIVTHPPPCPPPSLHLQDGAIELAAGLDKFDGDNSALESLDLAANEIGAAGAKALAKALKHNRGLRALYIGSNGIGDKVHFTNRPINYRAVYHTRVLVPGHAGSTNISGAMFIPAHLPTCRPV